LKIQIYIDPDLEDLIPEYVEGLNEIPKILQAAIDLEDFEKIRMEAHKMKGHGAAYGFDKVSEIGAVIEKSAKEKDMFSILQNLEEYNNYINNIEIHYQS
jgi:HPt (histidine-containing phosphotransfer) domain-containing protein